MKKITRSETETMRLAESFARKLAGGELVLLYGDLGTGKTIFAKGMARAFGIRKVVASPTFSLMNVYETKRCPFGLFVHIDCYRLYGIMDLHEIGALEHFFAAGSVTAIEWPERIEKDLPLDEGKAVSVRFYQRREENERMIEISEL